MKGRRNILLAKITLLHTKGEDKKPRVKTFTIGHHPDPVFDLLGQLLALAVADGVFAASIQDVKVIYDYPIPSYLLGEPLKYKPKNLDQPVIRQPLDGSSGRRTSETVPMTYQTFYNYITDLGKAMCLKHRLTWYLMEQARREHFWNAPTERLNAFLGGSDEGDKRRRPLPMAPPPPPNLLIEKRRGFVELIHRRTSDLSDNEIYKRRCLSMSLWVEMQGRKKAQQVGKLRKQHLTHTNPPHVSVEIRTKQRTMQLPASASFVVVVPMRRELQELQCLFCNADSGMDSQAQCKVWDRVNKLWDHVEKHVHKEELSAKTYTRPSKTYSTRQSLYEEREQKQPTTIFEFLDGCHTHLFRGLTVRNAKYSTKGDLSNPDGKLRRERIRQWPHFAIEQGRIWKDLTGVDFVLERHFKSLHGLAESGAELQTEKTGSELDLRQFQHETLTRPVRSVVTKLHWNMQIRQHFRLLGGITFENHGNTLSEESTETRSAEGLRPTKLRKTGRVNATPVTTPRSSRPLADEFCVYNKGAGENIPAYIVELKAPHKLPLSAIRSTLHDMDLEEVLLHTPDEPEEVAGRREMAAVITQAFSYMIKSGVGYGYVGTGEAFIFLHVGKDPTTVFYYLSTPGGDVGESTGYTGRTDSPNRLHLTAVGQVLAFTLRAMQAEPYCQMWRMEVEARLKPWRLVYRDNAVVSSPLTATTQEYTPEHQNRVDYASRSPVVTRPKKSLRLRSSPCNPTSVSPRSPVNSSDEDPTDLTSSPSKAPRRPPNVMVVVPSRRSDQPSSQKYSENQSRSRPYCTHRCLLGLSKGGPLDEACPNVADHGTGQHQINRSRFSALLHDQLLKKAKCNHDSSESDGCESLHIHGSRGALFEVVLRPYGYKLVVKGSHPSSPGIYRMKKLYISAFSPSKVVTSPYVSRSWISPSGLSSMMELLGSQDSYCLAMPGFLFRAPMLTAKLSTTRRHGHLKRFTSLACTTAMRLSTICSGV
ncbi:hypothetical protein LOZ57_006872 [Ophidiomyces ophidiicola]|uniref:uncharacterized protein n=1 Tax=Ophidiomyces ophidiicola TaxID=1387563 RepID=UPI0020C2A35F|nr:uncharacterized protein LOZ57_006872 [Ophidiomyces ophidiicola]KAI1935734.1 hypothetical protein LOZ57_006872 [Ophidiomyces ophidiicola]KAI2047935.1 hypothetical protein LOZ43_005510 [Ophidiomyces ophidiicola]